MGRFLGPGHRGTTGGPGTDVMAQDLRQGPAESVNETSRGISVCAMGGRAT